MCFQIPENSLPYFHYKKLIVFHHKEVEIASNEELNFTLTEIINDYHKLKWLSVSIEVCKITCSWRN